MTINLRLFARAKEIVGSPFIVMQLPQGATIAELRHALIAEHPNLESLAPHLLFAVGTEYVTEERAISEGDEIAVFPPVSGG